MLASRYNLFLDEMGIEGTTNAATANLLPTTTATTTGLDP